MSSNDDFIRSTGHLAFVNLFLKYAVLVLGVTVLALAGAVVYLSGRVGQVKPLPIYVNTVTGEARPVDFRVIDAAGEQRRPVEIEAFARDFLAALYTYNRLTVRSNLDRACRLTAPATLAAVKTAADLPGRADICARSGQGLARVVNVSILETRPSVTLQVIFRKQVVSLSEDTILDRSYTAVIKLKPVTRSVDNPHGLVVVEYSENEFKTEGIQ